MNRRLLHAAVLVTGTLAGCGVPAPGTKATVTPEVAVDLGTSDQAGRSLKRMDIDQLDASIRAVTGIAWNEVVDRKTVMLFDKLSGSLGKPDYQSSTDEDLTPGLLFQKFLSDAATMTCTTLVEAERHGGDRFLVAVDLGDAPDNGAGVRIDANLSAALLRFHGHAATPEDLEPWRWLFDSVYADTGDTAAAWRSVCVGLMTHPAFYAY